MKNQKFILWIRYNSIHNGRTYEKHIKIASKDIFDARIKVEKHLNKITGEITAEQLYYA